MCIIDIILIASNLSISFFGLYLAFESTVALKHIPTIDYTAIRSVMSPSKSHDNNDDDGDDLQFTSLENTPNPELLYNSLKANSDYYDRMISAPGTAERIDLFEFELQDFPDAHNIDNEMPGNDSVGCSDYDHASIAKFFTPYSTPAQRRF